jgi:hypothetical protein
MIEPFPSFLAGESYLAGALARFAPIGPYLVLAHSAKM